MYLVGDDLCDIKNDISYARITVIRLNSEYIKIMMIICPICVKLVATSTVVSPVTHTEVVEINKASINGIRCVVAFGNDSNPAPTNITNTKLSKKSNEA